jgi:hypothetical protein
MKAAGPWAGRTSTLGPGGAAHADIALPTRSGRLLDLIRTDTRNSTLDQHRVGTLAVPLDIDPLSDA